MERGQLLESAARTRLGDLGVPIAPDYYATFVQPERLFEMATSAARNVTSVLSLGLLILLYLVFMLAESVAFPASGDCSSATTATASATPPTPCGRCSAISPSRPCSAS